MLQELLQLITKCSIGGSGRVGGQVKQNKRRACGLTRGQHLREVEWNQCQAECRKLKLCLARLQTIPLLRLMAHPDRIRLRYKKVLQSSETFHFRGLRKLRGLYICIAVLVEANWAADHAVSGLLTDEYKGRETCGDAQRKGIA